MTTKGGDWITTVAIATGGAAIVGHHGSQTVEVTQMLTKDVLMGVGVGAAGGALAGIVSKESITDIICRTLVGGTLAAVAAPWLAETVVKIPTTSTAYPMLCCSIGVLGFQILKKIMDDPASLPVIGKFIAPLATKSAAEPPPAPQAGTIPPPQQYPPAASSVGSRPIRAPLAR
jgi:hypothetical protein